MSNTTLSFQTRMTADTLEQILGQACLRKYDIAYGPLAVEDGARKHVTVTFADPKDRDRFKAAINSRR